MSGKDNDPDVDKGYAWVILAGCYVMYLLVIGSYKAYGILYTEIDEYYDVGSGPVAFIGSLIFGIMFASGPFANYLAVNTSFRLTTFVGGLLLGIGYGSSFFVTRLEFLFVTLGILAGVGFGLTFAPCSTIISFYFAKRRALANGITVSASGIGAIGFSFLYKYLIETFALKPALLIMGGLLFNVCVAAACFRQPRSLLHQKKLKQRNKTEQKNKLEEKGQEECLLNGKLKMGNNVEVKYNLDHKCSCGPDFKCSLFKNPRFTLYAVSFFICVSGYSNNLILIPAQIKHLGFDKNSISTAVAITGLSEIGARVLVGWIADKKWITPKNIFAICFIVSSFFAFITPFVGNLYYMFFYSAIIGVFPASFYSLLSVLIIDVVGMKDFPSAYGLVLPGLGVSFLISQTCIAWLKDKTGNWEASFYVTAVLLLLPAVMLLAETWVISREYFQRSDKDQSHIRSVEIASPCKKSHESSLHEDFEIIPHRASRTYNKDFQNSENLDGMMAPLAKQDSENFIYANRA